MSVPVRDPSIDITDEDLARMRVLKDRIMAGKLAVFSDCQDDIAVVVRAFAWVLHNHPKVAS